MGLKLISPGGGSVTLDVPSMANTYTLMLPTSNSGSILTTAVYPAAPGTSGNVITSNGTAFVSQALVVTPIPTMNVFTSNGTFTIPASITKIKVTVVGGGGAGMGAGSGNYYAGGGGGGAGAAIKVISGLTPGLTLNVIVGSGAAGVTTTTGARGGTSNVYSGTQSITEVSANGGFSATFFTPASVTGPGNLYTFIGGQGGYGVNGDVNIRGIAGGIGQITNDGNPGYTGFGGGSYLGGGAPTYWGLSAAGISATGYGGGGGGATTIGGAAYTSGAGAAGVVIIEY